MTKLALGLIEALGLAAAFEAADTAVKSANIKLLGYELSKGGGLVTVKFVGDVSAVKAAVQAGKMAASKVNTVWSTDVIPRPHSEIEKLIDTEETVKVEKDSPNKDIVSNDLENEKDELNELQDKGEEEKPLIDKIDKNEVKQDEEDTREEIETDEEQNIIEEIKEKNIDKEQEEVEENIDENNEKEEDEVKEEEIEEKDSERICNICGDPKCPRIKGELRVNCIHYDEYH